MATKRPKRSTRITPYDLRVFTEPGEEYAGSKCVLWTGKQDRNGYGMVWLDKKWQMAHRAYYMQEVGQIPVDREVDHLCKQRNCINIMHLELVTRSENMQRQWRDRRNTDEQSD